MKNWINTKGLENAKSHTVIVQSLRNLILANSGIISALLVILGLVIGFQSSFSQELIFTNISGGVPVALLQLSVIGVCDLVGVMFLILSTRAATTLSFLGTIEPSVLTEQDLERDRQMIQDIFMSMQRSWLIGIRGLFYLVVATMWLIHPVLLMVTDLLVFGYLIFVQDIGIKK